MTKTTLDLRTSTTEVLISRPPDPKIPTSELSSHTKQSLTMALGKELLEETIRGMDDYYSTQERLTQINGYQERVSPELEKIKGDLLVGGDPNTLLIKSENKIKEYFDKKRNSPHGIYWANILEKETLARNRAEFASALTDGIKSRQAQLIDQEFKTQWMRVDREPANAPDAILAMDRLGVDFLRNTQNPDQAAEQITQWKDELSLTAIKRSVETSIKVGQTMYDGIVPHMSVMAIKKANDMMQQAASIHTQQNLKMEAMKMSAKRVETMMSGHDEVGNLVFIDPNNKQNQTDMDNDYTLTKINIREEVEKGNINPKNAYKEVRKYVDKVNRTGIIPTDYESDIRSYLNSGDISLIKEAAGDIESITRAGIKMSRKIDGEMIADSVTIMRWARAGVPDLTIMDRLTAYRKLRVEQKEYREKTIGKKIEQDKFYVDRTVEKIFPKSFYQIWPFTIGPFAPPKIPTELQAAAAAAVKDYYIYHGTDWEDAKVAAAHDLRQTWGATRTMNGNIRYMLNPPEMTYPGPFVKWIPEEEREPGTENIPEKMYGEHWTAIALREEMKTWDMQKKYDPKRIYLDFDSIAETSGLAAYRLMYLNKQGIPEELMTKRDNVYQPVLWIPLPKYYIKEHIRRKKQSEEMKIRGQALEGLDLMP